MSPRTVRLDPAAPYLADHRPGGRPLLGTAASLEILAEAARELSGGAPCGIRAVDILSPLILASGESGTVHIDCRMRVQAIDCVLESDAGRHLSCQFLNTPAARAPRRSPLSPGRRAVDRSEIYRLFFHGPAFQVVAEAEWCDGILIARLNTPLPPWHLDGRPTLTAPRLLEFALQSAGLLALAERPVMAIPRYIARVDRYPPIDEKPPRALFAAAAREEDGIGIEVYDIEGRIHLRVAGYLTAALPYPVERDRMDTLHRALRR
jgi:hypothetical protein